MVLEIKAGLPLDWGKEYYTVEKSEKRVFAPCIACDNTGKVTIKGEKYDCPRCKGNWREKEEIGRTTVFSVGKWRLESITAKNEAGRTRYRLTLTRLNSKREYGESLVLESWELRDMVKNGGFYEKKVYGDYKEAMAEVKRLNAAEKEKTQ